MDLWAPVERPNADMLYSLAEAAADVSRAEVTKGWHACAWDSAKENFLETNRIIGDALGGAGVWTAKQVGVMGARATLGSSGLIGPASQWGMWNTGAALSRLAPSSAMQYAGLSSFSAEVAGAGTVSLTTKGLFTVLGEGAVMSVALVGAFEVGVGIGSLANGYFECLGEIL